MEKDNPQSLSISEVIDSKKRVYLMSKKSFVLEHPSAINVLAVPKHCWNVHNRTLILFFHHSQVKWV